VDDLAGCDCHILRVTLFLGLVLFRIRCLCVKGVLRFSGGLWAIQPGSAPSVVPICGLGIRVRDQGTVSATYWVAQERLSEA
jgi:hypothetical protein